MKRLITALTAAVLLTSPVVAQTAAPLSLSARAPESTSDSNQLWGAAGIGLGFLVLVAIVAVAIGGTNDPDDDNNNQPASP